jgi:DNA-directed RNA polymerase specialized sigma24 family protein
MRFDATSFALGFVTAAVLGATRERLRPVGVEVSAFALHLARLGRAMLERQRETAEDLVAEVEARAEKHAPKRERAPGPAEVAA